MEKTIIYHRLCEAFQDIASGRQVDDLEQRLDDWMKTKPIINSTIIWQWPSFLSVAINENKFLQGREVHEGYLNSQEEYMERFRKVLLLL